MPTHKKDAKKLLEFIRRYLNVPSENITLMCSAADYKEITDCKLWDDPNSRQFNTMRDRPYGDPEQAHGLNEGLLPLVKLRFHMISRWLDSSVFTDVSNSIKPKWIDIGRTDAYSNYAAYFDSLSKSIKQVFSLQLYASHGVTHDGYQCVAID
jgi:hypothetical protein